MFSIFEYPARKPPKRQGAGDGIMAVGPPHITVEVPETGRREGGGGNAMSSEEIPTIHRDGKWVDTKLGLITEQVYYCARDAFPKSRVR